MILFHDDWKDYPDAILDTTTNPSFTRMAALYRAMGIKNHSWMLALHDPSLLGKDPFAEDITAETALAFSIEFKENPWAFFRFIARDPAGSNEFPIQFVANRGILASYWLFFNHILTLLIMIRQTGKSFGLDWLYTYLLNVRLTKSDISFLTKDEKLRGRELERLKAMELTMPVWMKQRKSTDPGNTEILRISSLENTFRAYVPNKSPKLADLIGRGMTAGITGVDEFAYIHNSWITIPVMLSASLAAREVAKMKNEPYGTLFATTSGKRDTPEGKYAYNFMSKAAVWNEAFMDAENHEHLCEMILKASPGEVLHVNCTFNHRQLGKDDKWLKDRLKESIQEDPVQVSADFLNEWPSGSNLTPFSPEQAKAIRESETLDFYTQFAQPEAYALRWYYPEDQIKTRMQDPHVLSLDPSDAVGQDAIGITLRNVYTGEVAMAADVSEGNLILFSRWICGFLHEYQSVTAIVERRSSGVMILDYLLLYLPAAGMDPFRRLFNFVVQDAEEAKQRFEEIKNPMNSRDNLFVKYKKLFGFATSGSGATSRTDLYSRTLNNAVKMTGSLMKDRKLILQTLGLEIRNGRVDHGEGEHDDLCFVGHTLVRTIDGNRPISELKVGDLVLTREGYKPVIKIFANERAVITKYGITGTPDHPFITPEGEIPFKELTLNTEVYAWDEKQSATVVKTIIDILSLRELILEITSIGTIRIRNLLSLYTDRCTKTITDLFQKECRYITKTETSPITPSRISSASHPGITEQSTSLRKKPEANSEPAQRKGSRLLSGARRIQSWLRNARRRTELLVPVLLSGASRIRNKLHLLHRQLVEKEPKSVLKEATMSQPDSESGERKTLRKPPKSQGKAALTTRRSTLGVKTIQSWLGSLLTSGARRILNSLENMPVPPARKPLKVEPEKRLVYNLHVDGCHEYFVEDILVHNCISWLLSYWLLSMGKNLRHYGIEPSKILSLNPMYQSQLQEQSAYDQYQTHKARHDVEQLTEQLKIESDEYVARRLEYDLELAIGRLSDQDRQIVSADDLIHKLREERTQRIRRSHSYGYSPNYGLSSGGTNRDPFRAPGQYGATVADYNPGDVVYTRF